MNTIAEKWEELSQRLPQEDSEEIKTLGKRFFYAGAAAMMGLFAEIIGREKDLSLEESNAIVENWAKELDESVSEMKRDLIEFLLIEMTREQEKNPH